MEIIGVELAGQPRGIRGVNLGAEFLAGLWRHYHQTRRRLRHETQFLGSLTAAAHDDHATAFQVEKNGIVAHLGELRPVL
jgi:hypothetical protein